MKIPVPPGLEKRSELNAWGLTLGTGFGRIPVEYTKMVEAICMDPPAKGSQFESALQTNMSALAYFGGAAWPDEQIGKCWAWSILRNFPEESTLSGIANVLIVGSYRFGLRGGCVPDWELMQRIITPPLLDLYYQGDKTLWLHAFLHRYGIVMPETYHPKSNGMPSNGYDDSMFFDWEPNATNLFPLWKNIKLPVTRAMQERREDLKDFQTPEVIILPPPHHYKPND